MKAAAKDDSKMRNEQHVDNKIKENNTESKKANCGKSVSVHMSRLNLSIFI